MKIGLKSQIKKAYFFKNKLQEKSLKALNLLKYYYGCLWFLGNST